MKSLVEKRKELKEIGYLVEKMNDQEIEHFYPNVKKAKEIEKTVKLTKRGFKFLAYRGLI